MGVALIWKWPGRGRDHTRSTAIIGHVQYTDFFVEMARQPTFQSTISRIVPPLCRFVIAHCEDGVIAGAFQLYSSGLYVSYCNKAVDCSHCGSKRGKKRLILVWMKQAVRFHVHIHMYIFMFVIGLEPHCRLFSWEKNKIQKFKVRVWMWAHVPANANPRGRKMESFVSSAVGHEKSPQSWA